MIPELRDLLFIDIETVASTDDYASMDERLKVQWSRKASFLRRDSQLTDEALFHERAGIHAEFGKIVCIAVGKYVEKPSGELCLKTKVYSNHNETDLLVDFKQMLEKFDAANLRLCAHNGKEFDFPYLCKRMLINSISLPAVLNLSGRKPWEIPHLDTLEMWKFGDHRNYTSLDLLAALFHIPSSKSTIDGSQVNYVYHHEKDLAKIAEYCRADVVVLAQLFLKLKGYPLLPDQNILMA